MRDSKAIVEGVFAGLKEKGAININKASIEELQSLPGIDETAARRIMVGRPYHSSTELLERRILPSQQYDRIASRIVAR